MCEWVCEWVNAWRASVLGFVGIFRGIARWCGFVSHTMKKSRFVYKSKQQPNCSFTWTSYSSEFKLALWNLFLFRFAYDAWRLVRHTYKYRLSLFSKKSNFFLTLIRSFVNVKYHWGTIWWLATTTLQTNYIYWLSAKECGCQDHVRYTRDGQQWIKVLSQYLTNLMHKICFTISFISFLYMFRAHVLISSGGQNCITQPLVSSHI